jgi:hypothetical protein
VGLAVVAYLVLFPLGLLGRRLRRRRRAVAPAERIALAWAEAAEEAELLGYREVHSDTFDERARRLAAHLHDDESAAHAVRLARRLEAATYSAAGADDLDAELAEESSAALRAEARSSAARTARVARWLDPRPWIARWGRGQLRHRRITTTVRGDLEAERELVASGDRR